MMESGDSRDSTSALEKVTALAELPQMAVCVYVNQDDNLPISMAFYSMFDFIFFAQ